MNSQHGLEPLPGPFISGRPVWTIVNGEPELRYYVETHNGGHVLAFSADLSHPVFYGACHLWACKAGVLLALLNGVEKRLRDAEQSVKKRREEFLDAEEECAGVWEARKEQRR